MQSKDNKADLYRWVRVGAFLSIIPIVLAAGPMIGYIAGKFFADKFHLPAIVIFTFAAIGFAASARETIRIIRLALKDTGGDK